VDTLQIVSLIIAGLGLFFGAVFLLKYRQALDLLHQAGVLLDVFAHAAEDKEFTPAEWTAIKEEYAELIADFKALIGRA